MLYWGIEAGLIINRIYWYPAGQLNGVSSDHMTQAYLTFLSLYSGSYLLLGGKIHMQESVFIPILV